MPSSAAWNASARPRFGSATLTEEFVDIEGENRGIYWRWAGMIIEDDPFGVGLNNWSYAVSKTYGARVGFGYEDYDDIKNAPEKADLPSIRYAPPAHALAALTLGGNPLHLASLVPLPLVCLFIGWATHNDLAFDSTAIWLHLVSGTRGVADRLGRMFPSVLIGIPVIAIGSVLTTAVFGDWAVLPSVAALSGAILVIGLGLASILLASAGLQLGMKIVSSLYLLWLAFQIARSSSVSGAAAGAKPLTFLQAAAFQWINPKAWLIAVGAISAYTAGVGAHLYLQVAIIAALSVAVSFSSSLTWAACGAAIGRWLRSPLALRLFNVLMAILLLASVLPILGEIWTQLRR